ncbi:MAG TPA: hypothetical protein VLM91_03095 [Candidatus Methylomirabilis sp.]|nr:hypothetical protein [Candidatus Methylomirabilis sp.]
MIRLTIFESRRIQRRAWAKEWSRISTSAAAFFLALLSVAAAAALAGGALGWALQAPKVGPPPVWSLEGRADRRATQTEGLGRAVNTHSGEPVPPDREQHHTKD